MTGINSEVGSVLAKAALIGLIEPTPLIENLKVAI
jgi:hypothetical protein